MEQKGDDDGDDDVSFAKWMSSFWGHSWQEEEKGLREHRLHSANYRKTSLPCPFPAVSRSTSECHPRRHSEDQEFQTQARTPYYKKSSASGSVKESLESKGQSDPEVQEFSESFAQRLCIKAKRSVSLGTEGRKDTDERECLRMDIRSHSKPGKGRSSAKEKYGETSIGPVAEKKDTDFSGHVFAGMFCIIYSLWESTKSILKHLCKKKKNTYCFGSKTLFYRLEILEGIVLLSLASVGIIASLIFSGGHHLPLYEENHWNRLKDWHHATIYFFFGMIGMACILCVTINSLPACFIKLMMSNAFFVETFIFHNHTHSRVMLDIFMHQLVGLVCFLNGLVAFIDFLMPGNVLLELLCSSFTLLQGTWFFQIAYVLFPPKGSPTWDLMDYENSRFLTVCFCWHYALTYIVIGVNYAFVSWLVKFRIKKACSSEVGLLKNTEYEQELEEEM